MPARSARAERPQPSRWSVSLTLRLALAVLGVGFVSMVAATAVGITAGQQLGRTTVEQSLATMRSSASFEITAQLAHYERLASQLAETRQATLAIGRFTEAAEQLSSQSIDDLRPEISRLLDDYGREYLDPLRAAGVEVALRDIVPRDAIALYLQTAYSLPEEPISDPVLVDDAGDGSEWSQVHARFHPVYRDALSRADLLDIYLVDADSERIVYSTAKGPDLGTSLDVGPYRGSVVGRAAAAAIAGDEALTTDLSFYNRFPGVPVGAGAAPVRDEGGVVGAVVLVYDSAILTERVTATVQAANGETRAEFDAYTIGADGRMRTDPQGYLADPSGFLDAAESAGVLPADQRPQIEADDTTVLVLSAVGSTTTAALEGDTAPTPTTSLTGADVVRSASSISEADQRWYVVAEVNAAAADSTVASFRSILIVGATTFVVVLAFLAVAWARRIMQPVRAISDRLGRAAVTQAPTSPVEPVRISQRSPEELHRLARSLTTMANSLRDQQRDVQQARRERLAILRRMLPASVAQRIDRGDVDSLDEVPTTTVVVVVVLGLGSLLDRGATSSREVLDRLHGELDDLALEHGLERIKVVGDSYFAACGHDRPYIDHAPRVLAFARSVAESVRVLGDETSAALDTAIAINTGPVTVGLAGDSGLVYDVWGRTVTVAHDLARVARAGQIVVAGSTRARLPEGAPLEPWADGATDWAGLAEQDVWVVAGDAEGARA